MSKKDKKFIAALVCVQTGIIIAAMSIFGKVWHDLTADCKELKNLAKLSQKMTEMRHKASSEIHVRTLKKQYENSGIGVEEIKKQITKE